MTRPKHPPITKARVYNCNYYYAQVGQRLVLTVADQPVDKPWVVYRKLKIRKFGTFGEAMAWADRKALRAAKKARKKEKK